VAGDEEVRMAQVKAMGQDVMDRVCIDPRAVSRWMAMLEKVAGSAAAVEKMPEERATVEQDGRLKVSLEWRDRSISMLCTEQEWSWAEGGLQ
jgi:hypothetical protein